MIQQFVGVGDLEFRDTGAPTDLREMVFYAGSPVRRLDFWTDQIYVLQMSMEPGAVDLSRMAGAPLLVNHDRDVNAVAGVIESASISGGKGLASFRLSDTPDTEILRDKIKQRIIRQVSMEADVLEQKDVTKAGDKHRSILVTKWMPKAVALVAVGADPGAILLSDHNRGDIWVPFQQELEDSGTGAASTDTRQRRALLAALAARHRAA